MNRRTGKVARLPKDLRELVNHMLDDGAQYSSVIRELEKHRHRWPDDIKEITENNLSNWHAGGYQDWVREQELSADLRARHDSLAGLLQNTDLPELHRAVVHIGVAQLYHALAGFNRDTLEAKVIEDPSAYARLLSVLLRFSDKAMELQKLPEQRPHPTRAALGASQIFGSRSILQSFWPSRLW